MFAENNVIKKVTVPAGRARPVVRDLVVHWHAAVAGSARPTMATASHAIDAITVRRAVWCAVNDPDSRIFIHQ